MFKDLFMPATGAAGQSETLETALALAAHEDAHLAVMVAVDTPRAVAWETYPAAYYRQLQDEAEQRAAHQADALRERLRRETLSWEVRVADAVLQQPTRTAALHAAHADLALLPAPRAGQPQRRALEQYFVDLLMESGRPLLTVPPGHAQASWPLQRIMVAWRPGAPAARALHDALPLLRRAAAVDVVMIDPQVGDLGDGQQPGADIATHLARHGLQVEVVALPEAGESAAAALLRHARERDAELIVSGGYSHSRYREQVLGGVTRELLLNAEVPVLFSH